jgi:hypothetical protein
METQSVYKISGGTIALINAMIEDSSARVVTSTPVSGLKQLADGVQVTVDDDRIITASAAVVTVPINVYKTIDFDPPLSGGKNVMATDGQLSQGIKVYVKLKENVGTLWGMGSAEQPFTLLQTEKYGWTSMTGMPLPRRYAATFRVSPWSRPWVTTGITTPLH